MKKISELTRRDIINIIKDGFYIDEETKVAGVVSTRIEHKHIYMQYFGSLDEVGFLMRLYKLDDMRSNDSKFKNAHSDILQHTVNNDDWENGWFFLDNRFNLSNGNDDKFLLIFLCEMFHPAVRREDENWKEYLKKINECLHADGYELYESDRMSGREVFSYQLIDSIELEGAFEKRFCDLISIGEGSYANVYKYFDKSYDTFFALKRAKGDLKPKEVKRFELEFTEMKRLEYPYIAKVYNYDKQKKEYTMELMDTNLNDYILKNNTKLSEQKRIKIILEVLHGLEFIHSKKCLHRDLSPKNVLIKEYGDIIIAKLCDFGLIKIPESDLTAIDTDFKGSFNDPELKIIGFDNYKMCHEIYATTLLIVFILTGKTNLSTIKDGNIRDFMHKGTQVDPSKRFKNIAELRENLPLVRNTITTNEKKSFLSADEEKK